VSIKKIAVNLQNRLQAFDWKLLVFLLLFLNVKLIVKVAAIILIYILQSNFKFGFAVKNSRLPLFYFIIPGIAIFNWLTNGLYINLNYSIAAATGIFFWILCILAIHQVKIAVEKNTTEVIHQTILLFFIINAVASLVVYAGIIIETGAINPYRYQGNFQKYFIGTGDYIKGITLDTSTTNAVINAFGVIYFLLRDKYSWALFCMAMLLLTGSNITNLLLCLCLLYIFVVNSSRAQKSIIVVCILFVVFFLTKVSPQNSNYVTKAYKKFFTGSTAVIDNKPSKILTVTEKPDSILTPEERKQKIAINYLDSMYVAMSAPKNDADIKPATVTTAAIISNEKPAIPQENIHSAPFQSRNDTTIFQTKLLLFIKQDSLEKPVAILDKYNMPGKVIAWLQMISYFKIHPLKIITGTGAGMFSSKLAFKITALKIAGGYPVKYAFINEDFKINNLALYLHYFTRSAGQHSLINTPNSTYTQLISEYGLAGMGVFFVFYIGFFARHIKKLTYGLPIIILMLGLFFMEYWFEQLSVLVLFELLLFVNIKEHTKTLSSQPL
jgi:hypothetical protein